MHSTLHINYLVRYTLPISIVGLLYALLLIYYLFIVINILYKYNWILKIFWWVLQYGRLIAVNNDNLLIHLWKLIKLLI